MGYIQQTLWDILSKTMGYIRKNYGIYGAKLWDIFGNNRGIYRATTIGYFMGYIWPKLWDILV